ncbi:MAG: head-tail adaptor protein [Hyphomicrobiales bacterium]|nr:MAG: head-tail adaptor protein [Hyphomicrobiales bacterium]
MQAGKLNNLVSLQQAGTAQDEIGQPIPGWPEVAKIWADIRYMSGLESIRADASVAVSKVSIRIRKRDGVVPSMRIVDAQGVIYAIESVLPNLQNRQQIDLVCEVVNG